MARRARRSKSARPPAAETAGQALRRLLAKQYATVLKREPSAAKGSVEGLHDLRVALRRMRSLATTFRKLDADFLGELDRRLSKVCDRMGEARDLDVWIGLFRGLPSESLGRVPERERRAVLALLRRERAHRAAEALDCALYRRTKKMLAARLKRRAPARGGKKTPAPETFAARRILEVRELIAARHRRVGNYSKGPAHDLRRAGRRLRYLTEFFAPRLGPACVRAGKWITKAQAALGKVHDCDSALEFSKDLPSGAARAAVRRALKRRRAEQLRKFKIAWRHYAARRLQQAWRTRLEAAAAG